jgi:2-polyprenyl-6-methoxyphenol hydroxylase-like FAD-dependent oxidoreductase
MAENKPILIVGAGPTGLSLALFLHELGLPFRIIDRNKQISPYSRALYLQPRTLEIFEMLNCAQAFTKSGRQVKTIDYWIEAKRVAQMSYADLNTDYPYLLLMPQNEIEAILIQELKKRKIKIERGKELVSLYTGGSEIAAVLADSTGEQEEVHPAYLIGCDGAHSTVRHQCGFSFDGKQYPEMSSLADVYVESSYACDSMSIHLSKSEGAVAIFPFKEPGKVRLVVTNPAGAIANSPYIGSGQNTFMHTDLTSEKMQDYLNEKGLHDIRITSAEWLSNFHIHKRISSQWRRGNIFVAGDAAHIHSPLGGQGMNTGIQDSWNLAWKLYMSVRYSAAPALLGTYEKERHYVGTQVLTISDRITKMAELQPSWLIGIRNWFFKRVIARPSILQAIAYRLSQLAFCYPSTACTIRDYFFSGGPKPGLRAPNCNLGSGKRLYNLIGIRNFTCLVFTGLSPDRMQIHHALRCKEDIERRYGSDLIKVIIVTPQGHVDPSAHKDEDGVCHKSFGAKGGHMTLIRPDGHIALQHEKIEKAAIESYLKVLFPHVK